MSEDKQQSRRGCLIILALFIVWIVSAAVVLSIAANWLERVLTSPRPVYIQIEQPRRPA